ncbi:MAG TPA: P1 family peptidase [Acidimicrobiales bacterium]|nr:P1 family peptidase [Acidimicrobiales bacterium]
MTRIPGVRVGHWTDPHARTGCTVVLLPEGTLASGEVRGGAPATREFALLEPSKLVHRIDAVLLTGGSAFGLDAAAGVMRFCEAEGHGYPTAGGVVPIVVAMGVFDLAVGDGSVRPGLAEGEAACDAAVEGQFRTGSVGAGTGCTVDKWRGPENRRPGGLGTHTIEDPDGLVVTAIAVVNAFGIVLQRGEEPPTPAWPRDEAEAAFRTADGSNTIVGVILTNAILTKADCLVVAQGGHDGIARTVHPPHTSVDGDAIVAAATGQVEARTDRVRALAVSAFSAAIRDAVPL